MVPAGLASGASNGSGPDVTLGEAHEGSATGWGPSPGYRRALLTAGEILGATELVDRRCPLIRSAETLFGYRSQSQDRTAMTGQGQRAGTTDR
jgi:hypothetical protein